MDQIVLKCRLRKYSAPDHGWHGCTPNYWDEVNKTGRS